MKNTMLYKMNLSGIFVLITMITGGCSLIEDVFAAGFWTGLIGVLVILLIIFGIVKLIQTMSKK
jgi:hypothetical protein